MPLSSASSARNVAAHAPARVHGLDRPDPGTFARVPEIRFVASQEADAGGALAIQL